MLIKKIRAFKALKDKEIRKLLTSVFFTFNIVYQSNDVLTPGCQYDMAKRVIALWRYEVLMM
jgi:hypothetical protein